MPTKVLYTLVYRAGREVACRAVNIAGFKAIATFLIVQTNTEEMRSDYMALMSDLKVFNNAAVAIKGWYWALPSKELKRGKIQGLKLLGLDLAIYRGESGKVYAIEAYCPHMGAHFKEGSVEKEGVQCAFHGWKFDEKGECIDIPCLSSSKKQLKMSPLKRYAVAEKYGLIWVNTEPLLEGETTKQAPLPEFKDFAGLDGEKKPEVEYVVGGRTFRPCRPEVVMLNAIDAHHFNTVHPEASSLAKGLNLVPKILSSNAIRLENESALNSDSLLGKLLMPFYRKGNLTYFLDYWYASTGVVTLGPDFMKLYLLFPHRPTLDGGTEGIMVFLSPKLNIPFFGKWIAKFIAWVTGVVGGYFERGDRNIFMSINFSMKAPIKADLPIIEFIRHTENQEFLLINRGK